MLNRNFLHRVLLLVALAALAVGIINLARAQDTSPPSMPTGLTATAVPSSQVNLSWTASTDDVGVVGYYVYRNGGGPITTTGVPSFTDTGLSPGGYSYTVAAYDAAGNVSQQSSPVVVTLMLDNTPPSTPANFSAVPVSSSTASYTKNSQINLSWTASTDNVGVWGYHVYRNGMLISSPIVTSASYTDYVQLGTYTYAVDAVDAAGNVSGKSAPASVTIVIDITPPGIPSKLSAVPVSSSQINLSWTASTDNVGVLGYYVYRNSSQVGTVATTSFADAGLSPGTYAYTVSAYDAAGNVSFQSSAVSATIVEDVLPPSIPANLSAVATSSGIYVSWTPSTDNVGVAGYYVYRGGNQVANVTSNFYSDPGLSPGLYDYGVSAYDAAGNVSFQSLTSIVFSYPATTTPATTAPATTAPAPPPVAPPPAAPPTSNAGGVFTAPLYFGSRNDQVKTLQSFLIQNGYLGSDSLTGFFGTLTGQAVEKFQCDYGVVCGGSPADTGWGLVGAKTRGVLNGLYAGGAAGPAASSSYISQLQAQIQMLQTQLLNLELQLQSLQK